MNNRAHQASNTLNIDSVIKQSELLRPYLLQVLEESCTYEIKGILHSEMLFFLAVAELLKIEHFVESGRARAQSTEIIARWVGKYANSCKFDSVEFDDASSDIKIADKRLSSLKSWVNCLFGDSAVELPNILSADTDDTIVLIDGPKGLDAVHLAVQCLQFPHVKAVCIHDLHRDDKKIRKLIENNWFDFLASDNKSYVNTIEGLDEECWNIHQQFEQFRNWGPYQRGNKKMLSYGPTLLCLINNEEQLPSFTALVNTAKNTLDRKRAVIKKLSGCVPNFVKQARFPRFLINKVLR